MGDNQGEQLSINELLEAEPLAQDQFESQSPQELVAEEDTGNYQDSEDSAESKTLAAQERIRRDGNLAPMLRQYLELKDSYSQHLLLFQVGDFYEVFFDDAPIVADVLNIRLTSRNKDQPDPIPMCGVPIHALDNYLPKLITAGYSCVIVSQVDEALKKGAKEKGMVRREISRIVTPGVRFDGDGLDERRYNYLAAACIGASGSGAVSFVDVSTGHLRVQECEGETDLRELIERIHPSELLIASSRNGIPLAPGESWPKTLRAFAREIQCRVVSRPFEFENRDRIAARINSLLPKTATAESAADEIELVSPEGWSALSAVLDYVDEVSFGKTASLSQFSVEQREQHVFIDTATRRNLEITETRIDGDKRNSLLGHIDYTKTAMGSRLLSEWIVTPLRDRRLIEQRLAAVKELTEQREPLDAVRRILVGVRDIDRLLSRVTSGRATPRDCAALRDSLAELPELHRVLITLSSAMLATLAANFDIVEDLSGLLAGALVEEPPTKVSEGAIFRDGYHSEVDSLRAVRRDVKQLLANLEEREKARTGINALKVKFNNVFGYFIEVTKTHLEKIPSDYERKQTLANAERFITRDLKDFEVKILSAKGRQVELEKELFVELRNEVSKNAGRIHAVSRQLSQLDVLCSFAHLAIRHNYTAPEFSNDSEILIEKGRHPVVERVLGQHNFVPNDTRLQSTDRRFAVLTGPNMGGKSTYLRQVGLIQLLAQSGCFVPAERARLGIVDRIFTRIGAADDLSRGDSTFMVEMREAATILRKATSRSLVLIDEIGRGTATTDGLAIATAIAEWLYSEIRCLTVFATHFHELTHLADSQAALFCLAVGVIEAEKEISFTHRIEEKTADRSYGIEVARLAGLPERLLDRATFILEQLDSEQAATKPLSEQLVCAKSEERLVPVELSRIKDALRETNPNSMTPIAALNELYKLKALLDS